MSGSARRSFAYRLTRYGYRKPLEVAEKPVRQMPTEAAPALAPVQRVAA